MYVHTYANLGSHRVGYLGDRIDLHTYLVGDLGAWQHG